MKFSFFLLIAFFCPLIDSAWAGNYRISAAIQLLTNQNSFHREGSAENKYTQVTHSAEIVATITGTGPFSALNKTTKTNDTRTPGVNSRGHSNVALARGADGVIYLNVDLLMDDTISGLKVQSPAKYSAPVSFTKGSWDSYQAGQEVVLVMTPAGQKMADDALSEQLKIAMSQIRGQVAATGMRVGELKVNQLASETPMVIKAGKERLETTNTRTNAELSFIIQF